MVLALLPAILVTSPTMSLAVSESDTKEKVLSLDYEAYFGGMHVGSGRANIAVEKDGYRVDGLARARGILDWYSGWRGKAQSYGDLRNWADPAPKVHENMGNWKGEDRAIKLTFLGDGEIDVEQESPPDENELTPIPEGALDNTIDPISALVGMSGVLAEGGACEGELKLYDGRRRFDLAMTDAGTRIMAPNDYNIYEGEARVCRVEINRIGGFRIEQSQYSKTARDRTVLIAQPFAEAPPIPVRVDVQTAFGTLVVHLSAARMAGREIAVRPGWDNQSEEE